MKDIAIIGAGGLAKEVAFLLGQINENKKKWNIIGFVDKDDTSIGVKNGQYEVIGSDRWLMKYEKKLDIAFGIGDPMITKRLSNQMKKNNNLKYPNLIHPSAMGDWGRIKIGVGNTICAGNNLTTDISIGSFNYFNINCLIGHDVLIGNYNVMNPSVKLGGNVIIKDSNYLGLNSIIIQSVSICSGCKIGVGAIIINNIIKKGTYFGAPARMMIK